MRIDDGGTMVVNGTLQLSRSSIVYTLVNVGGRIENNGEIRINLDPVMSNGGDGILNSDGATFINRNIIAMDLTNSSSIITRSITNRGDFENESNGIITMSNAGSGIHNNQPISGPASSFTNDGTIICTDVQGSFGNLSNGSNFINTGTYRIVNGSATFGCINNGNNGTLNNSGIIEFLDPLSVAINNSFSSAEFNNTGTIDMRMVNQSFSVLGNQALIQNYKLFRNQSAGRIEISIENGCNGGQKNHRQLRRFSKSG